MSIKNLLEEATAKGIRKFVLSDINNTSAIIEAHRLTTEFRNQYPVQPIAGIDFRLKVFSDKESSRQELKGKKEVNFIGIAKKHHGFYELNKFLSKCLHQGENGLTGREAIFNGKVPEFEDAFIIYPFSSLRRIEGRIDPHEQGDCFHFLSTDVATALRPNEFIGIKPSDLNRLKFSPLRNHIEKLVVLAPVTFRNKVDFNAHRLLRAMDNNVVLSKLPVDEQASPDEIMMREEELSDLYKDFQRIIYNTQKLLDECEPIRFQFASEDDGTKEHDSNKNKKHFLGSVTEDRERLIQLCEEGMLKRYPNAGQKIRDRYQTEIDVISKKKFSSYFLINHNIIEFARRKDLFYVGRGSGANSMVAYLLYITDVDPLELDLYFERFINPSRKNPPDFDIDFSSDERNQVIEHIFNTYGKQNTALLATYSEMKDDSLIRELGKVFGLPKAEIDALQDYRNINQSPDHITRLIYQYKEVLQSFPSHLSIHAGGILISEKPIEYYTALSNPPKGFPLTQFSMQEAEDVGFAKFDILSQRGLGKVRDAINIIRENKGDTIDIHDVKKFFADKNVRDNLKHAKLMGCFYVESPAMRMLLTKLEAETYLDLVAASSIIRPGVAQSGMMQEFIRRFHMKDHGEKIAIPELWEIMPETFGVMVYQEDVIKVAYKFGGFTLEEADKLRRGMGGKYRGRQEFLDVKDKFFSNCRTAGKDEKLIEQVWFQMETFGGYAFAKGHSASYAVESYQCMFLKTHYPLEYMVAVINNGGGFFGQQFYIHEARMCGGTIHAPDINKSTVLTTIDGKDIYLGFNLLNDLERKIQLEIVAERNRCGEFSSLENFMKRISISAEQLHILIRIGAFRFTGRSKQELLWDIHKVLGHQKKSEARKELFETGYKNFKLPSLDEMKYRDTIDEMEILGFPLQSPFDLIKVPEDLLVQSNTKSLRDLSSRRLLVATDLPKYKGRVIEIVGYYVTRKPTSTKKGEPMMFGCFLDRDGAFFDTNHFPEATKKFPFRGAGCYRVKGKVAEEFGFYSINVLEMYKIDYVMYEDDAETKARSQPDPLIVPPVVPASKECEYLLVISPPPHIEKEVMLWKKKFHQQFDHYSAVTNQPQITLCNFSDSESREMEIVKQVSGVVVQHAPIRVALEDFDVIPSHTVYVKVLYPDLIIEVVEDLKTQMKRSSKTSRFISNPYLAIARGLDKEKFARASAEFCLHKYAASFIAGSITLLKREANVKFAKYKVVKEFRLEGKPPKQLSKSPFKTSTATLHLQEYDE